MQTRASTVALFSSYFPTVSYYCIWVESRYLKRACDAYAASLEHRLATEAVPWVLFAFLGCDFEDGFECTAKK